MTSLRSALSRASVRSSCAGQTAEPDDISRQDRRYLALAMF
jgi:hypothetical protein